MSRHRTFSELVWPTDPLDTDLPVAWAKGVAVQVLDWVWRGYDELAREAAGVDFSQQLEQLERNLTELHFYRIQRMWAKETEGFSSVQPGHEMPELLSRSSAGAKPPAYDLGFVHPEQPLWKWPIEAKLLPGPAALAEYLKDVRGKFESGVAAPIVGEGGMIGYLLKGEQERVIANLAKELSQELVVPPEFSTRLHRTSRHERAGKPTLRLHHMIMVLNSN